MLLSNIGVVLTLMLGVIAMLIPQLIQSFVSIKAVGKEGVSEIRATYGGFFIGIAIYALYSQSAEVFGAIGLGWIAAALIRLLTILTGSFSPKNVVGVIFEGVIGGLCLAIITV